MTIDKDLIGIKTKLDAIAEQFKDIFDKSKDLLGIDVGGYFMEINPIWSEYLGWTLDELQSIPWVLYVHPDDIPSTLEQYRNMQNGVHVSEFQNRYRCKDGSYKRIMWDVTPINIFGKAYFHARRLDP